MTKIYKQLNWKLGSNWFSQNVTDELFPETFLKKKNSHQSEMVCSDPTWNREQEIISEKLNNSMKRIIMRSMFRPRCYCIVRGCSFCVAQCWLRQGELSLKMKAKVSLPALPTRTSRTWWIVLPFVGFACAELFYNQTYRTKEFLRLQMKYYFSACTGNVHRNVETFLFFLLESRMECQRYCFDKNKRREEKVPVIVHEGHLCLVFAEFS